MPKRLHFSAFQMISPGNDGIWRVPGNERSYLDVDFWRYQSQLLERAGFDALFLADVLGMFETRESGIELAARDAQVFPLGDPFVMVAAMASATTKLGFVVTASTSYEPPYLLARRFSTLDHVTRGRIGWNIVTSYLDTAAANFGLTEQVEHDERYARADEYLQVVEGLWDSWEEGAVLRDRESGVYVDPSKIAPIDHVGRWYSVKGPLQTEPGPQRKPVFFQATASAAGFDFAIKHSEALYTAAGNAEGLRKNVSELRRRADEIGRIPPKVFSDLQLVVGETESEAKEKARAWLAYRSDEGVLAWNGIDIRAYPRETKLSQLRTFGNTRPLRSIDGNYDITIQDYIDMTLERQSPWAIVGSPDQVVDRMVSLAEETGLDGFSISSSITPGSYEDFAEHLTPRLRDRGHLTDDDTAQTLRERISS